MGNYIFSNSWFDDLAKQNWEILFSHLKPKRILEIGSYEGASACYSIRSESCRELYCIDTWEGGIEHDPALMNAVEVAFDYNIAVAMSSVDREIKVIKRKGVSSQLLPALLHEGHRGRSISSTLMDRTRRQMFLRMPCLPSNFVVLAVL